MITAEAFTITGSEYRAYAQGREARRQSSHYQNPHPAKSAEMVAFYEGWCWQNFLAGRRKRQGLREAVDAE